MSKKKNIIAIAAAVVAVAGAAVFFVMRGGRQEQTYDPSLHRFKSINIVSAYIALVEKPDAKRALLSDDGAETLRPYFENAGVKCLPKGTEGRFDLVIATSPRLSDWKGLAENVGENGAVMWLMDVRKTTIAEFRDRLAAFPCPETHFWMPGETDWVLSGRIKPRKIKLSAMLDLFARDDALADLTEAQCDSVGDVFASFAGYRDTIEPAFTGNLEARVKPEFFVTKDIPDIPWIVAGDVDEDILRQNARDVRSKQIVRRVVIEGNMLSQEGKSEEAVDKWAGALLHNPHDTMLLDRVYRLAVNARTFQKVGNFKTAAKCYETMVGIRPTDSAALVEYSSCMRILGEKELADRAFERARELTQ